MLLVEQNASRALSIASRGYVADSGLITMAGPAQQPLQDPRCAKRIWASSACVCCPCCPCQKGWQVCTPAPRSCASIAALMSTIVIATRESCLALWQAEHVRALLTQRGTASALLGMTTRGDQILTAA